MIGKVIGAVLGARAARGPGGVDQPGGAVLGMVAVAITRRFGFPGMIAAALGGYAIRRYSQRQRTRQGR